MNNKIPNEFDVYIRGMLMELKIVLESDLEKEDSSDDTKTTANSVDEYMNIVKRLKEGKLWGGMSSDKGSKS